MRQILAVMRKELKSTFGSPMAAIFIGAFLLLTLFVFFWVESFFARNSADLRPLFRWLPLLLVFLVATLTMRQWSEEQRMGTLEVLLTLPVRLVHLVLGKFLAVFFLTALALALTLGLPVTVSMMGPLDWGPVLGGYLGALLMAGAYIALGLWISSRTDNQIVALILTVLAGGAFYFLGSPLLTGLVSGDAAGVLRFLSTSSRFEAIERGVLDLRDVVYYLSLTGIFLALNVFSLDQKRWSRGPVSRPYRKAALYTVALVCANLFVLNLWLGRLGMLRADLTAEHRYTISDTTRDILAGLREPLLMRGYFSHKTHPLLTPLLPYVADMLREYQIAAPGAVRVEIVDPRDDEEIEAEARSQYGIEPIPFQVTGRYEAAVVNSYFHILIKYGDQFQVLDYRDLIEVDPRPAGPPDVRFKNLEYDLTSTIKKVVYGFKSVAAIFENVQHAELVAIVTPETLPASLEKVPEWIDKAVAELNKEAFGKLSYRTVHPDEAGRKQVAEEYGIRPHLASLFSDTTFYLDLFLEVDGARTRVYFSDPITETSIRKDIEAALKRGASGFLKTVGLWTPDGGVPPMLGMRPPGGSYRMLREILKQGYNVEDVDLSQGRVPAGIDVLVLVGPQRLDDVAKVAVDQYLMRGGSLIVLGGRYELDERPGMRSLALKELRDGVTDLLEHYGVHVDKALVMDEQNEPFPVPVNRNIGGVVIQEIHRIAYPYFVDVRPDAMAKDSMLTANLPAVTMNWVSPLRLDRRDDWQVTELLRASDRSWTTTSTVAMPDFKAYPELGFPRGEEGGGALLAVAVSGSYQSAFSGKEDPRVAKLREEMERKRKQKAEQAEEGGKEDDAEKEDAAREEEPVLPPPLVDRSPGGTRLAVVGSSSFITDTVLTMSRSLGGERFLNNLQFVQNLVDWAVEDEALLAIRSRGGQARLLDPMSRQRQRFWELLNYGLAIGGLLASVFAGNRLVRRQRPLLAG